MPAVARKWQEVVTSGRGGEIEARLRRSDGSYRWFLCRAEPARDDQGTIVAWYGTDTEIEDRKNAVAEAKRIVDAIPLQIVVLHADGTALTGNRGSLDYHGLTVDQVANHDARKLIFHPEDVERLKDERQQALARGMPFSLEWRARRHDGEDRGFLVQYNPLRNPEGRVAYRYRTGTDIQKRKPAQLPVRNHKHALPDDDHRSSLVDE